MPLQLTHRRVDSLAAVETPLLVLILAAGSAIDGPLTALDAAMHGSLGRALSRRDFRGARDETLHLAGGESGPARVLLVGMGKPNLDRARALRRAATLAGRRAHALGVESAAIHAPQLDAMHAEQVAVGLALGAWEYTDLKTPLPLDDRRPSLDRAVILSDDVTAAQGVAAGAALADGYAVARRLAQMPGNLCTPDFFAETARDMARRLELHATVLGRSDLEREKMGSFLCVAQGTAEEPRLIVLEYRGGAKGAKPIVLVGKGLCFDSGGISIKPAQGMEHMKYDMCGAAGVLGAVEAIARMKLAVNVVGIIGATTNMPSATAVKPGDVVRASNGKFIEVINTDAEGRLVLADLLVFARRYEPAAVVDAATLTGACVIALGHAASGVFGTDAMLVQEVLAAGRRASEPGWELPLWDEYGDQIKSDVADIKNTGGRAAGAITAALFLKEFADGYPWAHLDIAGTAYSETDLVALPKGPTGVPVGTFVELVRQRAG
ncbi:MAG: leucyl aminopeptidase [Gemmatimonadaceae bacterium]